MAAEPVALESFIATALGTAPDSSFEKGVTGLDARHTVGNQNVALEVKTTMDPEISVWSRLEPTDHGRQMSDQWLAAKGEDPDNTCKVLVHGRRWSNTADVYIAEP